MSDLWWPKFIRKPRLRLRMPQFRGVHMPSKWIFFAIVLVVYYFIVSGSIFSLSYVPPPFGGTEDQGIAILYRGLSRQYLLEGIVGGFMYLIGFVGFYFMYHSTRHIYRPRYSQMLIAIGIVLIFVSFVTCQYMVNYKIFGPP